MTSVPETSPPRSAEIRIGLAIAVGFAGVFLFGALWNPVAGLPLAVIFLTAAYGIHKRRPWCAYGGALLLAALAAVTVTGLIHAPQPDVPATGAVAAMAIFGLAVLALFRAGRRMPATPAPASRNAWIALAATVVIFPQFCRAYVIGTGSMENTIRSGDQILVLPLAGAPTRGLSPRRGSTGRL